MSHRLRILVVGASSVLGRAIVAELSPRHDIVWAGFSRGVEGLETGKTYRVI
jgi:NAD(P)-dependent dehydrogenase (short-subunit alcohol dehydrogenase family)